MIALFDAIGNIVTAFTAAMDTDPLWTLAMVLIGLIGIAAAAVGMGGQR